MYRKWIRRIERESSAGNGVQNARSFVQFARRISGRASIRKSDVPWCAMLLEVELFEHSLEPSPGHALDRDNCRSRI